MNNCSISVFFGAGQKIQFFFLPVTEQLFVFNKEAKLIREREGRFTCTDCGHVYSSMLGDDEIPETCNKCKKKPSVVLNNTEPLCVKCFLKQHRENNESKGKLSRKN